MIYCYINVPKHTESTGKKAGRSIIGQIMMMNDDEELAYGLNKQESSAIKVKTVFKNISYRDEKS